MNEEQQDSLASMLDAYFGARIDDEALGRLNQELLDSEVARQEFWKRASLEETLESWGRRRRGEVTALAELEPQRAWWRQWPVMSGWAAAIIVLGVLFFQSLPKSPDRETEIATVPDAIDEITRDDRPEVRTAVNTGYPVAFLSQMVGVASESRYLEGQALGAGEEIRFSEGLMEITLYSGARVAIQGPARFVANNDLEIAVMEGRVEAEVPESAIGFKVVLPDGVITDFGTKFDLKVSGDGPSRVQVLEGEIELAGADRGQAARRMFRGEAMSMSDSGQLEEIGFSPLAVDRSLKEKADQNAKTAMERWRIACRKVDADESVIAHFSMLPEERGNSVIKNQSLKATSPKSGTVISAAWSEGRWPGKPALSFRRPPDRVRIDIPGEFPQATFIVWARIDGLPRTYNGLFYSEHNTEGEVHWQFSSDGEYLFGVRPKDSPPVSRFHRAHSKSVISPWAFGSWRMLATTYDSESREVIHYVDGDEVSRTVIDASIPLRFGRATLGNFFDPYFAEHSKRPDLSESWSFRNWTGAIDEFILYGRALDSKELVDLYEAGRAD